MLNHEHYAEILWSTLARLPSSILSSFLRMLIHNTVNEYISQSYFIQSFYTYFFSKFPSFLKKYITLLYRRSWIVGCSDKPSMSGCQRQQSWLHDDSRPHVFFTSVSLLYANILKQIKGFICYIWITEEGIWTFKLDRWKTFVLLVVHTQNPSVCKNYNHRYFTPQSPSNPKNTLCTCT